LLLLAATALTLQAAESDLHRRLGFYQWLGESLSLHGEDLLTQARRLSVDAGTKAFRLYVGGRFDYIHPILSPRRFRQDRIDWPLTPAKIMALPRYQAVIEDPEIETVVLTVYPIHDYGDGPDDLNLQRPWGSREEELERAQTTALCEFLYRKIGHLSKTIIIANNEADEKLLDIFNYTGSTEIGLENMRRWTQARYEAIEAVRKSHPESPLRLFHAFEISLVNLRISAAATGFRKTARWTEDGLRRGWNALEDVVPHVAFDLISYSSYESANSPFETRDTNHPPRETFDRLRRDLDRIRDKAAGSVSDRGRQSFGENFVMIGELGYARDRFEHLPTGGLLPRLYHALRAAIEWGCPYVILWQVFDAPRDGDKAWGFGVLDRFGETPALKGPSGGCRSLESCLDLVLSRGLHGWAAANGY
jgi:hypothetical protein